MRQLAKVASRVILAGGTLLGAIPAPAAAQPDLSEWRIDQERVAHPVAADARVEIVNPWGSVTLRAGEGGEVTISTAGQRHREDPREAEVRFEETPQGLRVTVHFGEHLEVEDREEWQARRVDLGVFLPASVALTVRTGDGDVEVRDLVGPADLETVGGEISFRGVGGLRARSERGSIFAQLRRSDWAEPVELTSVTGDLRVELLEGATAGVEIETRGPITSDYTMIVDRAPGSRLKRARATVGAAGGQAVRLKSTNGAVRLTAVIVPEERPADEEGD